MNEKCEIAVLISGSGKTLQGLIDHIAKGELNASIKIVISDQKEAYGLERAEKANIPVGVIHAKDYSKHAFEEELKASLIQSGAKLIVLAGFMRILSPQFVRAFQGRILNIHPSLLPKYPGLHTYERALAAGEKEHGSTVHIVTETLDLGPIILQKQIPILPHDTKETLKARTQALEYTLYSEALRLFLSQRCANLLYSDLSATKNSCHLD